MNVYIPNLRLPSAYQEVEYIQSSGTQYIDTLYNPQTDTEFDITYELVSHIGADDCIFGCRKDYNMQAYYIGVHYQSGSETSYYGFGDSFTYPSSVTFSGIGVNRNITYKNGILSNGSQTSNVSINSTPYGNLYIFCDNHNGTKQEYCAIKLYSFKLTTSGTLVRDLVPCYRKSDNVIGMYDLVNNQFYTNSGTGTFSKGNDVTMAELKNAYIGEYKGFEYSYDFRNKSASQLATDGRPVFSGRLETGSNGITSSIGYDILLRKTGLDLSAASKITISTNIIWNRNDTDGSRAVTFGLMDSTTQGNNMCIFYIATTAFYKGTRVQFIRSGTGTEGTNIGDIGTGTYTPILEIDLVNKKLTGKISGYNNSTYTLTDELVSFIRGLSGVYVYTTQHTFYIQNVSVTVE